MKNAKIIGIKILAVIWLVWLMISRSNQTVEVPISSGDGQQIGPSVFPAAVVTRVIDGDTLVIDNNQHVRLIGINAPEKQGEDCYSLESQLALSQMVLGKTVNLEIDKSETDRYGRLLRYIWLDGVLVNEQLVVWGYAIAKAYKPDVKYQDLLTLAQQQAQADGAGIWSDCRE